MSSTSIHKDLDALYRKEFDARVKSQQASYRAVRDIKEQLKRAETEYQNAAVLTARLIAAMGCLTYIHGGIAYSVIREVGKSDVLQMVDPSGEAETKRIVLPYGWDD